MAFDAQKSRFYTNGIKLFNAALAQLALLVQLLRLDSPLPPCSAAHRAPYRLRIHI